MLNIEAAHVGEEALIDGKIQGLTAYLYTAVACSVSVPTQ